MINFYKLFFGFSYFRFKVKNISFKKTKKEIIKKRAIIIFFHPKINNNHLQKVFYEKWTKIFNKLSLNPVFLTKESFNEWWNEIKKQNNNNNQKTNKNKLFNKYFIFISDKHSVMREYRTILLNAPRTYFLKNQNKFILNKEKNNDSLFLGIYDINNY